MKRKPIILKVGSTMPDLAARRGDFEDWILVGMGLSRDRATIVNPVAGDLLPNPVDAPSIVVTGSHAMVTDRARWSDIAAQWLKRAIDQGVPLLGICYGHQLIANALGGVVDDNPHGREFGTVPAHLTTSAATDPLLGGLNGEETTTQIDVQTCHTQSVVQLPPGARVLATSALDPHLAYRIDDHVWGVQFHPEFDAEVVKTYIRAFADALRTEGQDPDALLTACRPTPYGATILRRFAQLIDAGISGAPV